MKRGYPFSSAEQKCQQQGASVQAGASDMGKFSLHSKAGCKRLIALLFLIMFVAMFFARIVTTDNGRIKNEQITIDVRGAQMNAELYYPAGASDKDSLPGVIVCHGGGVNYNCMRPMALELARRGFVVLNMSFYGSGLSEMPAFDDGGQELSVEAYNERITPGGQIDAIRYLQSLSFVDATRIGLAGHSAGGVRAKATALTDGIYFSLNDLLINVLYNEFGESFTEEEIYQDAYALAQRRLNDDQYRLFEEFAAKEKELFDTRIRTAVCIGSNSTVPNAMVEVAGHEVVRSLKVNWFSCSGEYQRGAANAMSSEDYMNMIFSASPAEKTCFYVVNDETQSSINAGKFDIRSDEISAAADVRQLRGTGFAVETHAQNFLSVDTNANIINIMEATLKHDSGIDPAKQMFPLRLVFTGIALAAMLALILPVVGLLTKTEFFASCVGTVDTSKQPTFNKRIYWLMGLVSVAAGMYGVYRAQLMPPFVKFLPQFFQTYFVSQIQGREYIHWTGLAAGIILVIFTIVNRKKEGISGLSCINNGIKVKSVFKCFLIGIIYLALMFTTVLVMNYLFYEDFRVWNVCFGLVNVEDWFSVFPFFVDLLIFYVIIGASVNYTVRKDIPQWKDTLITIVINTLGIYIMFIISRISNATAFDTKQLIDFDSIYGLLFFAPFTTYVTRKMYNMTKNIWTGAMINACLISWNFACGGYNSMAYHAQNIISNFFGV